MANWDQILTQQWADNNLTTAGIESLNPGEIMSKKKQIIFSGRFKVGLTTSSIPVQYHWCKTSTAYTGNKYHYLSSTKKGDEDGLMNATKLDLPNFILPYDMTIPVGAEYGVCFRVSSTLADFDHFWAFSYTQDHQGMYGQEDDFGNSITCTQLGVKLTENITAADTSFKYTTTNTTQSAINLNAGDGIFVGCRGDVASGNFYGTCIAWVEMQRRVSTE